MTDALAEAIRNFGRASANYGRALERGDLDLLAGRAHQLREAAAYLQGELSWS